MNRTQRLPKLRPALIPILAVAMVLFLFPLSAAGDISGQADSVDFRGTVSFASWVRYDTEMREFSLRIADGQLRDAGDKGRGDPGQIVEFSGNFQYDETDCEHWNIVGGQRFDANFPFNADTGSFLTGFMLPVVADYQVQPIVTGGCAWEEDPLVHEHFSGTVTIAVVLASAEECPKKKKDCNQSTSVSGTFTVELASTPFDGEWTSEDFQQSWSGQQHYNGTWFWTEVG